MPESNPEPLPEEADAVLGPVASVGDGAPAGSGRRRSTATYPYHNLHEAIRFAEAVERIGGNDAPEDDVLKAIGLSTKANRAWTYRVSSAREFGLVQRNGRSDDHIRLTDVALRYLRPSSDEEKTAALFALFLSPPLYRELMQRYHGAPLPTVEFVANVLVRHHGILASVSTQAASAFRESLEQAGLIDGNGRVRAPEDGGQPANGAKLDAPAPSAESAVKRPMEEASPDKKRIEIPASFIVHEYPLRRGMRVLLPLPEDLTADDVKRLHKWLGTLPYDEEVSPAGKP